MTQHSIPELGNQGLRKFGITTGAIVAVLFGLVLPWLFSIVTPYWPWMAGGVLALWGVAHPSSLNPVYRGWMRFGLLISKVTTPIMLGFVFFLVIMPIGLVMRIFRDPMSRTLDDDAQSYRVVHEITEQSMEQPF
ncbi:MAG: SxtJ family membrane protein [Halioglobus sp.]